MGFQFFFQRNFEEFANGCGWGDTLGPSSTPPSPSFASAPQRLYVGRGTSETLICFGSEKQSARSPGFCVEKCGSRPLIFHGCMSWQRPDSVYLHWEHFNTIHVGNCGLVRDLVICEIDLTMKTRPHIGLKQVAELYLIFIDAMPRGFVCQLHYHGGGSLLCQTSTGDSWQLPFAHAPPHVRIGHTVSFSLAADRDRSGCWSGSNPRRKLRIPSAHCREGTAKYPGESSKACPLLCKTTYQEAATKYRQISQCRFGRKASDDWSCGKFAQWLVECGRVGWWCHLQVAMSLCWMASCTRLLRSEARSSQGGCCKRGCHGFSA